MLPNIQAIPSFTLVPNIDQNDSNEPSDNLIQEEYINLNESIEHQLKELKKSNDGYQKLRSNEYF